MKIAAFLDGRPGHEKQTAGIIRALSQRTEIEVFEIKVKDRLAGSYKAISEYKRQSENLENNGSGFDIVIGTGSKTHICVITAKLLSKAKAVICMSPEKFFLPFFDLCFVPVHDDLSENNNVFKTAGPPGINIDRGHHDKTAGLVLIGGIDEKSHYWDQDVILENVEKILKSGSDIKWTVSTSPRTPDSMDVGLKQITDATGSEFRPFSSTPRGWLESMYDECKTVWVTADSISMVYEALSAGCRVGVIPVLWKKKTVKFQRSFDFLISRGLVAFYPESPDIEKNMETFDEAGRCAEEIISRWLKKD
ncbi:ELM1/GtrOC1 family putative glycosyltransferase [Desulforegula conservatrix]|uniref:ELM1/GtrOC1 family putative glycosyltransferase n=1 Tax=Desulforegula conservatrix TaxID=153026 RepID=UPI000409A7B5|nr:ELM1/GtrOC1 family putative glycosyltransferase [Desulforegula conservatrix]